MRSQLTMIAAMTAIAAMTMVASGPARAITPGQPQQKTGGVHNSTPAQPNSVRPAAPTTGSKTGQVTPSNKPKH